jgi:outer membrane protein OmpA-like peptidoglycan-associated protein
MKKLVIIMIALLFAVGCSMLPSTRPEKSIYVATLPLEECEEIKIEKQNMAIEEENIPLPQMLPVKSIHVEESIMFDFDSSVIREDQVSKLDNLASMLNDDLNIMVIIDGYASKEGPKEYNQILSEKRANSVKDAIVDRGINANRIKTVTGKGATAIFGDVLSLNRKAIVVSIK